MEERTSPRLLRGNCLELLQDQPDATFDLLLTDPPYGTTNLAFDQARIDWAAWWRQINRVCKPHAMQVLFAAQPFAAQMIHANPRGFAYDLIWAKTYSVGFLAAKARPLRAHEHILVFRRRSQAKAARGMRAVYNIEFTEGTPYRHRKRKADLLHYGKTRGGDEDYTNPGRRYPTSVLHFGRDAKLYHPTQKPLALCLWLIRAYSNRDGLVLDPFMGGGSSGVAALMEGRRFVGMELDEQYFEVAQKRLVLNALPHPYK